MARKIFSCFISLFLCLLIAAPTQAQYTNSGQDRSKLPVAHKKKKEKDPNIPVYPLLYGLEVGVDLWGPGSALLGSDNFSAEAVAALNMKNRFFPTVEIGYGKSDNWSEEGIHYKTGAPYFRLGMDYNVFYKKKFLHKLLVGVRYGFSSFKYDVASLGIDDPIFGGHFNPNIEDDIWGGSIPFNHPGMKSTMQWLELCGSIRAHVWRDLYMGWSVRFKFRLSASTGLYGDPAYVPGYGTFGSNTLGITYTIIYRLPVFIKNKKP